MVSFDPMDEYYEYEIVDENMDDSTPESQEMSKDHVTISHVVETVVEDEEEDVEYIEEIVVTDDEEEEDSAAIPPSPPKRTSTMAVRPKDFPSPAAAPPSPPVAAFPPIMLTPSKKRAKAASSAGLSELSKQLRILQAKNESQAVDINRLERQLRILADLQGINVSDLRKALEDACASEAFGELQNRVSKLKYELEAATLAKQAELRNNTSAPHIANLELRVGELEEVEEKQQTEIRHLYEQLRHERAKSTRLESENEKLKKEREEMRRRSQQEIARANGLQADFQQQMHQFQENQAKKMLEELEQARSGAETSGKNNSNGIVRSKSSSEHVVTPEMAAEYERMSKMLRERDEHLRIAQARLNAEEIRWAKKLKEVEEKARQTQMDLAVELDKLKLTVEELEDADGQSGLRLAQYKARFTVQDERIEDMEQQLDSLYTAFTMLKDEFDSESAKRATMLNNLNDADAEIARQANKLEKQKSQRGAAAFTPTPRVGDSTESAYGSGESVQSVPRFIGTPSAAMTTPGTPSTPPSPNREYESHSSDSARREMDLDATPAYASAQPFHPKPQRTSSTWELILNQEKRLLNKGGQHQPGERLISGPLVVESKGMLRKWKTKPCTIYLRGDHYQWKIGDKKSFPLQFGISKVEFHPNYPLSFVVHLNPSDATAPVVHAACSNERDYHRWMGALTKATSGDDYQTTPAVLTGDAGGSRFSFASSGLEYRNASYRNNHGMDDEAAELQRILELSRRET